MSSRPESSAFATAATSDETSSSAKKSTDNEAKKGKKVEERESKEPQEEKAHADDVEKSRAEQEKARADKEKERTEKDKARESEADKDKERDKEGGTAHAPAPAKEQKEKEKERDKEDGQAPERAKEPKEKSNAAEKASAAKLVQRLVNADNEADVVSGFGGEWSAMNPGRDFEWSQCRAIVRPRTKGKPALSYSKVLAELWCFKRLEDGVVFRLYDTVRLRSDVAHAGAVACIAGILAVRYDNTRSRKVRVLLVDEHTLEAWPVSPGHIADRLGQCASETALAATGECTKAWLDELMARYEDTAVAQRAADAERDAAAAESEAKDKGKAHTKATSKKGKPKAAAKPKQSKPKTAAKPKQGKPKNSAKSMKTDKDGSELPPSSPSPSPESDEQSPSKRVKLTVDPQALAAAMQPFMTSLLSQMNAPPRAHTPPARAPRVESPSSEDEVMSVSASTSAAVQTPVSSSAMQFQRDLAQMQVRLLSAELTRTHVAQLQSLSHQAEQLQSAPLVAPLALMPPAGAQTPHSRARKRRRPM